MMLHSGPPGHRHEVGVKPTLGAAQLNQVAGRTVVAGPAFPEEGEPTRAEDLGAVVAVDRQTRRDPFQGQGEVVAEGTEDHFRREPVPKNKGQPVQIVRSPVKRDAPAVFRGIIAPVGQLRPGFLGIDHLGVGNVIEIAQLAVGHHLPRPPRHRGRVKTRGGAGDLEMGHGPLHCHDLMHLRLGQHEGLFAADVLPGPQRVQRHRPMEERRRGDVDRLNLRVRQQILESGVHLLRPGGLSQLSCGLKIDIRHRYRDRAAALGEYPGHVIGNNPGADDTVTDRFHIDPGRSRPHGGSHPQEWLSPRSPGARRNRIHRPGTRHHQPDPFGRRHRSRRLRST